MTGVLDTLLRLVAGASAPAITPEATNVLRFPAAAPPAVRTDVLVHTEGGLTTDATLRPRVSVLLGPGATFQGIADTLIPLYVTGAAGAGGKPAPTRDELARAIVVYNRLYLPAQTWAEHRVGLRLPLPIEIEQPSGTWIVNADSVREQAAQFDGAWLSRLTHAPTPLDLPDPMAGLPQEASTLIAGNPAASALGTALMASVLRNASASVFLLFEVLRQLTGSVQPIDVALALLDGMVTHQAALLASTSAGQGVLRRLDAVLASAPASTDAARLSRDRDLLTAALFVAPGEARTAFLELPETAGQLKDRGPVPEPKVPGPTEPTGGSHRIVLGRDVAVGRVKDEPIGGVTYRGPAYAGRLLPAPFATADAARMPTDASSVARLAIVSGIAPNEGNLDAVRLRDAGILSSGIHQWSAPFPNELPSLLFRFKGLSPEEFSLYFGMYGLDVIPDPNAAHVGQFILQRVDASGVASSMDYNATRAFFDGAVEADGTVVFGTTWASRFRLASLTCEAYRRCQLLEAMGRFDRIKREVGNLTVAGTAVAVETLITSRQGVALLLDSHINKPNKVKPVLQTAAQAPNMPADPDQRDRRITKSFHDTRNVYDRSDRNKGVDAAGFDVAHGTFAGW
jgi:hypothetical protein